MADDLIVEAEKLAKELFDEGHPEGYMMPDYQRLKSEYRSAIVIRLIQRAKEFDKYLYKPAYDPNNGAW